MAHDERNIGDAHLSRINTMTMLGRDRSSGLASIPLIKLGNTTLEEYRVRTADHGLTK